MSEQESIGRINALLADMPPLVGQRLVQQLEAEAARIQEEPPAPLVPRPAFPYGMGATRARWSCRTSCGWSYEEDTDPGPPGPLVLPVNFTADDVSAAISAQATARHETQLNRIQAAFTDHYRAVHPELLEDIHGTPAPAER